MAESFDIVKKDFSSELPSLKAEAQVIAKERSLEEAITLLLIFEKKCRLNNDLSSLKEVCLFIIQLCKDQNDWARLNSSLMVISKRRAQNKYAVSAIGDNKYLSRVIW